MTLCTKCNVEIEENRFTCPLCDVSIEISNKSDEIYAPNWPKTKPLPYISQSHKLFLIWLPLTIISTAAFLIILIMDLVDGNAITWSQYPLISIGVGVLFISSIFLFTGRFFLMYTWYGFVTLSIIMLLDRFFSTPDWFFSLGLPIISIIYLYGIVNYFILMGIRKRILLFMSFNFITSSVYCIFLDIIITHYRSDAYFTWSPIVSTVLICIAFLGLYYLIFHKKQVDLTKFFHF